jgi:tetratricopeptide (TPR) repeat protein
MEKPPVNALRPLAGVRDAIAALRIGGGDREAERTAYLRVSDAIEAVLRRLLRDEPDIGLEVRLRALAPDEMALDEVLSVLRKRDRLSIETAAAIHEMASTRRRLAAGGPPGSRDVALVLSLVEAMEREVHERAVHVAAAPPPAEAADRGDTRPSPPEGGAAGRSAVAARGALLPGWAWAAAVLFVVLIVFLGIWSGRDRSAPELSEGITLFRSGELQQAAVRFERYVARRPEDPTGRLYLARVYRRMGRYEQASNELRHGLEAAPADAALHRELGLLLLDVGRPDAATSRFRTAIELDAESTEGWLGLIRALRESGDFAAAERVLARAPAEVRAVLPSGGGPRPGTPSVPGS